MFEALNDYRKVLPLLEPYEKRLAWPMPGEGWDKLPEVKKQVILEWCDREVEKGYPMLLATQFLAFVRSGSRKAFEDPYFARRRTMIASAVGECLEHSDARLDSVINGLWCTCEESYWGLSAHNGDFHGAELGRHGLPDTYNQYIDLFAAQTSVAIALIRRLLGDLLDAVDTRINVRLEKELESRIFSRFMDREDYGWMGFFGQKLNNWTPWIVSSVLNAAAAVMKDDIRLAQLISRATGMLDRWLAWMPEDGGLDEGIGYWNMAGGALLDCLECLRTLSGGRIDYYDNEKVRRIGSFPLMSYIGKGWHFNFADCDARPMLDGERIYIYGVRTHQPELAQLGARMGGIIVPPDTAQMNRTMDAIFTQLPEVEDPQPPARVDYDKLQVWSRSHDGLYAVIKGGHNDESHNHNDVGSFIVFADGEPILVDAGNAVYTRQTFSDERYTLWHIRSRNHNVPLIGEYEQAAGRQYAASDVSASAE